MSRTARYSFDVFDHIEKTGSLLRSGGIAAIPTETVYGLAANALDAQAVARIFAVKERPADNPLIVHVARPEHVYELCGRIPDYAKALMSHFFPGPLTLVLPSNGTVPPIVTAGLDTVAVRCPGLAITRAIIDRARRVLAAPSANLSGRPSPTRAEHVLADLDGKIDAVIDGGACLVGIESTVVDCTGEAPLVLRKGGVTLEDIQGFVPNAALYQPQTDENPRSPGLKHRHYAPATPLTLLREVDEAEAAAILRQRAAHESLGVLCYDEQLPLYAGMAALSYGSRNDAAALASGLYDALRRLDAMNMAALYAHCPMGGGLFAAVRDRLERAAQG